VVTENQEQQLEAEEEDETEAGEEADGATIAHESKSRRSAHIAPSDEEEDNNNMSLSNEVYDIEIQKKNRLRVDCGCCK
jgi:hypothetical protein